MNIINRTNKPKILTARNDIIAWLDKYEINNYTLTPDDKYGFIVDVHGNVDLYNKSLKNIPIKFNTINGFFNCSVNNLTSLEFCPKNIHGSFYCDNNKLTNLEFCPKNINGNFYCGCNKLTSLEFCPKTVNGYFNCGNNNLSSLKFCPDTINGSFFCDNNNLTSLEFFPKAVNGTSYFGSNELTGLDMSKEYGFTEIYKIHCEHKIIAEQSKLEGIIEDKDRYKNTNRKIKI